MAEMIETKVSVKIEYNPSPYIYRAMDGHMGVVTCNGEKVNGAIAWSIRHRFVEFIPRDPDGAFKMIRNEQGVPCGFAIDVVFGDVRYEAFSENKHQLDSMDFGDTQVTIT